MSEPKNRRADIQHSEIQQESILSCDHLKCDQSAADSDKPSTNCFRFDELSDGNNQVCIEFRGKQYVLRRTRTGGLILNKQ